MNVHVHDYVRDCASFLSFFLLYEYGRVHGRDYDRVNDRDHGHGGDRDHVYAYYRDYFLHHECGKYHGYDCD